MYIARWLTDETVELDYFSHTSPTYNLAHTELARALGADYRYAGENLHGVSFTLEGAMQGWLNSEPHKKGILNLNHKYIGSVYFYHNINNSDIWSLFM